MEIPVQSLLRPVTFYVTQNLPLGRAAISRANIISRTAIIPRNCIKTKRLYFIVRVLNRYKIYSSQDVPYDYSFIT